MDPFADWLAKRSVKLPAEHDHKQFTETVMARVTSEAAPHPLRQRSWWSYHLPAQLGLAVASAAVMVLIVGRAERAPDSRLARNVEREIQLLAALNEPAALEPEGLYEDGLAEETRDLDTFALVEAQSADDQWVDQTLQLLDQLDQDPPQDESSSPTNDDWIKELDQMDEHDLNSTSS